MFDYYLEERIALESIKGYKFLEKEVGEIMEERDLCRIIGRGLRDSFYALQINHIRWLARLNKKELTSETKHTDIIHTLTNRTINFPNDLAVRATSNYFTAMYHFVTKETQEKMIDNLVLDVTNEVPYAGIVLTTILKSHYDTFITKPHYRTNHS